MNKILELVCHILNQAYKKKLTDGELFDLFSQHKCAGLLYELSCPKEKQQEIAFYKMLNRNIIYVRYQSCASIFTQLEKQKIPYAVIKGAVLSLSLYGNAFVRRSGDIDLLICRNDADRIKQLLLSEGFIQGRITEQGIVPFSRYELLYYTAQTHQLAPFIRKTNNPLCPYVNVDVNFDLLWGEANRSLTMDFVLSKTELVSICNVTVRKLKTEMEFISLCLHHYKDMNSLYLLYKGKLKLGLFCDLYAYLSNAAPDPKHLAELCDTLSVSLYVKKCISDTEKVFGKNTLTQRYLQYLHCPNLPDTYGLAKTEIHPWPFALPERLFVDIRSYFDQTLSLEEKEKIKLNNTVMML